jgi:hypothetical protein
MHAHIKYMSTNHKVTPSSAAHAEVRWGVYKQVKGWSMSFCRRIRTPDKVRMSAFGFECGQRQLQEHPRVHVIPIYKCRLVLTTQLEFTARLALLA